VVGGCSAASASTAGRPLIPQAPTACQQRASGLLPQINLPHSARRGAHEASSSPPASTQRGPPDARAPTQLSARLWDAARPGSASRRRAVPAELRGSAARGRGAEWSGLSARRGLRGLLSLKGFCGGAKSRSAVPGAAFAVRPHLGGPAGPSWRFAAPLGGSSHAEGVLCGA